MVATVVNPNNVRRHVNMADLRLEAGNEAYQQLVHDNFTAVFDEWRTGSDVDPYGDAVHEVATMLATEWGADRDAIADISSAYAHTIREAVIRLTGQDPSTNTHDLTLAK